MKGERSFVTGDFASGYKEKEISNPLERARVDIAEMLVDLQDRGASREEVLEILREMTRRFENEVDDSNVGKVDVMSEQEGLGDRTKEVDQDLSNESDDDQSFRRKPR